MNKVYFVLILDFDVTTCNRKAVRHAIEWHSTPSHDMAHQQTAKPPHGTGRQHHNAPQQYNGAVRQARQQNVTTHQDGMARHGQAQPQNCTANHANRQAKEWLAKPNTS